MKTVILKSNAKINLYLNIVGVKDGFHLLDSLFLPIDLYDELSFFESDKDIITGLDIPMEDNIIYKTIKEIRSRYNIDKKVRVNVDKKIPFQAGLGGGSSNASVAIKALQLLWDLNIKKEDEFDIALKMGSDVPFFLENTASIVRGRGEIITPLDSDLEKKIKRYKGILIFDNIYFNTKEVYKKYDELNIEFSKELKFNNNNIFDGMKNDLEKALINDEKYLRIKEIKETLKSLNALYCAMSGSGGSVFGIFKEENINEVYKAISSKYQNVWMFSII